MPLFLEITLAILAFLGQVVCFWAIWKFLDHIFHPHLEKLKKPIEAVAGTPVKKPRKPRTKKVENDPKILKLPKEEKDCIVLIDETTDDFLLTPVEMEFENYTKRRKKSRGK